MYEVRCKLRDHMATKRMNVGEVAASAGVSRETVGSLKNETWDAISRRTIGRICGALSIDVGELLVLEPADIWHAVRLRRELTIHYGSSSIAAPDWGHQGDGATDPTPFERQIAATRDLNACRRIMEHAYSLAPGVQVRLREHAMEQDVGFASHGSNAAAEILAAGSHVLVGSPLSNPWTEPVLARLYGAAPFSPAERHRFPFGFAWRSSRSVSSSFGWQAMGGDFGIVSTDSGKLVARRDLASPGTSAEDCGLIVVFRIPVKPRDREFGRLDERVIICLLGHGGVGTEGVAMVATDPEASVRLRPAKTGEPGMFVVSTRYLRPLTKDTRDNLQPTGAELVDCGAPPRPATRADTRSVQKAPLLSAAADNATGEAGKNRQSRHPVKQHCEE